VCYPEVWFPSSPKRPAQWLKNKKAGKNDCFYKPNSILKTKSDLPYNKKSWCNSRSSKGKPTPNAVSYRKACTRVLPRSLTSLPPRNQHNDDAGSYSKTKSFPIVIDFININKWPKLVLLPSTFIEHCTNAKIWSAILKSSTCYFSPQNKNRYFDIVMWNSLRSITFHTIFSASYRSCNNKIYTWRTKSDTVRIPNRNE
jgi:hypothetical protein